MKIEYKIGDVLKQKFNQNTILVHGCNDIPIHGSGIAGQIRKKYPLVTEEYELWNKDGYVVTDGVYVSHPRLRQGEIQLVCVEGKFSENTGLAICNLISQKDCGDDEWGRPPVRYESIEDGLFRLHKFITKNLKKAPPTQVISVRLGCGLGGGAWDIVEEMFEDILVKQGVPVTIYDFK